MFHHVLLIQVNQEIDIYKVSLDWKSYNQENSTEHIILLNIYIFVKRLQSFQQLHFPTGIATSTVSAKLKCTGIPLITSFDVARLCNILLVHLCWEAAPTKLNENVD